MSVLHVSHELGFESVRRLAVRKLFPLASALDKIVCGHQYHVQDWLLDAYVEICHRPAWLTREEGRRLGVDDVISVAQVREQLQPISLRTLEEVRAVVKTVFRDLFSTVDITGAIEEHASPTPLTEVHGEGIPLSMSQSDFSVVATPAAARPAEPSEDEWVGLGRQGTNSSEKGEAENAVSLGTAGESKLPSSAEHDVIAESPKVELAPVAPAPAMTIAAAPAVAEAKISPTTNLDDYFPHAPEKQGKNIENSDVPDQALVESTPVVTPVVAAALEEDLQSFPFVAKKGEGDGEARPLVTTSATIEIEQPISITRAPVAPAGEAHEESVGIVVALEPLPVTPVARAPIVTVPALEPVVVSQITPEAGTIPSTKKLPKKHKRSIKCHCSVCARARK